VVGGKPQIKTMGELKVWKLGGEGFFESLIKRSVQQYKCKKIDGVPPHFKSDLRMDWVNKNKLQMKHTKSGWKMDIPI
jgi:hypothetical protein